MTVSVFPARQHERLLGSKRTKRRREFFTIVWREAGREELVSRWRVDSYPKTHLIFNPYDDISGVRIQGFRANQSATFWEIVMHDEVGWITAIIVGGIAGWLAEQFMKSDMGLLMNIVLGIVGAAIASAILSWFGIALGGWVGYLISGFIGACLLIWIVRLARGTRAT